VRAERRTDNRFLDVRVYVGVTVLLACALGVLVFARWGLPNWSDAAFFWCINATSLFVGRIEVPVGGLSLTSNEKSRGVMLSPGFVVLLTAAYATNPPTALLVALVPALPELIKKDDRGVLRLVFNSSQEAIYIGVASVIFVQVRDLEGVATVFGAAMVAAVAGLGLNTVFVAGVVALDRGVTLKEVAGRMTWTIPHSIAFGVIALMVATLYAEFGPVSALFLFMPLAILRFVRQAKIGLDFERERALTGFVRGVEEKDPYTYRHSERVASMTVELHRELGARAKDLEQRWSAALLHDVGKMAVPTRVLTKASSLTDAEFELIKAHPALGADVVADIELLRHLAPEIRHHHERLDGRGYPDGLKGTEIPHAARVLAVADAFDAMTSDRPYRKACSTADALAELERTAGSQHDPEVVAALGRVLARLSFVRSEAEHERAPRAVNQ
jgi:putative nucleotidyltransferase with HDIG domain